MGVASKTKNLLERSGRFYARLRLSVSRESLAEFSAVGLALEILRDVPFASFAERFAIIPPGLEGYLLAHRQQRGKSITNQDQCP